MSIEEYETVNPQKTQTRTTFNQIFTKLAEELDIPMNDLQIGIEFRNGQTIYYPYVGKDKIYIEENHARNIDLEDYIPNAIVNGWAALIDLFIKNLAVKFANDAQTEQENITIFLKPDLALFEGKIIFKWDLPTELRKKQFPACNGLPLANLAKKKDVGSEFRADNLQFVDKIDIEREILM
jgi:hypothetical protein